MRTGGANDTQGLLSVADLAGQMLRQVTRPLTAASLRLADGKWTTFRPDDPALGPLVAVQRLALGKEYKDQKAWLDRLHEKTHQDTFVANCIMIRRTKLRAATSLSIWTKGATETLLPKVDNLAFTNTETRDFVVVPWDKAVEIVGHLMAPTDYYPVRYRTTRFPTDQELESLRPMATGIMF